MKHYKHRSQCFFPPTKSLIIYWEILNFTFRRLLIKLSKRTTPLAGGTHTATMKLDLASGRLRRERSNRETVALVKLIIWTERRNYLIIDCVNWNWKERNNLITEHGNISKRRVFMAVTCNYGMKTSMRSNNTLILMHYFVLLCGRLAVYCLMCLTTME